MRERWGSDPNAGADAGVAGEMRRMATGLGTVCPLSDTADDDRRPPGLWDRVELDGTGADTSGAGTSADADRRRGGAGAAATDRRRAGMGLETARGMGSEAAASSSSSSSGSNESTTTASWLRIYC